MNEVIDAYNKALFYVTKGFKGRLPRLKSSVSEIPKNFMSVKEYIVSKTVWKQIMSFLDNKEDLNPVEYTSFMVKHWSDVALAINMTKADFPIAGIIFSPKMRWVYDKLKENETISNELNKNRIVTIDDSMSRLKPTMIGNINSLFRLKKLNFDLSYHDIVTIFAGEFDSEFSSIILSLDEETITPENIMANIQQ